MNAQIAIISKECMDGATLETVLTEFDKPKLNLRKTVDGPTYMFD